MIKIPLEKIPNQKINVQLSGKTYNIYVQTRRNLTFLSLYENSTPCVYSRICLPNRTVAIPKHYLPGVLLWHCQNDETPFYKYFGLLHNLYYATPEEISEVEDGA